MQWLEALNQHLQVLRESKSRVFVTCATVETTPALRKVKTVEYPGWSIEERRTPRGNIALHLFPSVA
jgi:hypothetical protein